MQWLCVDFSFGSGASGLKLWTWRLWGLWSVTDQLGWEHNVPASWVFVGTRLPGALWGVEAIFDDNNEVCEDCMFYNITPYAIRKRHEAYLGLSNSGHAFDSFPEASPDCVGQASPDFLNMEVSSLLFFLCYLLEVWVVLEQAVTSCMPECPSMRRGLVPHPRCKVYDLYGPLRWFILQTPAAVYHLACSWQALFVRVFRIPVAIQWTIWAIHSSRMRFDGSYSPPRKIFHQPEMPHTFLLVPARVWQDHFGDYFREVQDFWPTAFFNSPSMVNVAIKA